MLVVKGGNLEGHQPFFEVLPSICLEKYKQHAVVMDFSCKSCGLFRT